MMYLPEIIVIAAIVTAILCAISPKEKIISPISMIGSAVIFCLASYMLIGVYNDGAIEYGIWYIDGLSTLFIEVTAFISLMVSMYSNGYLGFERKEGILTSKGENYYYGILHAFIAVMMMTCMVSSMGILWIMIEATTLASTFLVGYYKNEQATEAAWKYIMICSVGITLALMGLMLVFASASGVIEDSTTALNWPVLFEAASKLDPALMKTSMVFIIIGFGTKMGLAPMHTWLPDAHSQAPTPVSAMLSAVLLNCAMYGIVRFLAISNITIPGFGGTLLMIFGFLSLSVAAASILTSHDMKRMLAFSSVEHMGIMAIGFGIGTETSVLGALFMVIAHSVTKSLMFFSAGNVIQAYGTREMNSIRGLKKNMPFTSLMLTCGSLAIVGVPPFSVFIGEIIILGAAISSSMFIPAAVMIILIVTIFAGFTMHIFPMMSGNSEKEISEHKNIIRAIPFVLLLGITLLLGLFMPEQMKDWMTSIASSLFGGMI